ncbi:MAG: PstS family phosphate ABC transporter substrate-binding protein [Leptotrichiaceae bacterium]|jgi:phosphate transport system substrate-binding protein
MKKTLLGLLGLLMVWSCGNSGINANNGGKELKGEIIIDGSSTVAPISSAVAEEFFRENRNVNIAIGISGTGGGFKKFAVGEIDIANASRKIKEKEAKEAKKNGVEYIELQVALDGIAVVVNKENTWAQELTEEDLKKIWENGSKIMNWKEINPSWPSEVIKLYGPDQDSGTFDYFVEEILGKDGQIRIDYSPSSDDNQLVQGVEGDKGSLGFFGYAYYIEQKDKLNAVAVNGVRPTDETVKTGKYKPLSRPLYIYVNKKSLKEKPEVRAFVEYYLKNASKAVKLTGYVPLSDYTKQLELIK